jgi:hypothetical protein
VLREEIRPSVAEERPPATPVPAVALRDPEADRLFREGVRDFLRGRFERADRRLSAAAETITGSSTLLVILGAVRFSHYLIEGETDTALQARAESAFRAALRLEPGLQLDPHLFSPRIIDYLESVRRTATR